MHVIALLPGLVAAWIGLRKGAVRAFLDVYLPCVLLLPDYYATKIVPGIPPFTFNQAAILPCALFFFVSNDRRWSFSLTDVLVMGYACAITYSEFLSLGYKEAQHLGFIALTTTVLPYILAKGIIEPYGRRVEFAKRATVLFAVAAATMLYETRMGFPLVRKVLDRFFPGQGSWVTTFRWGLARAAGPYGHSIVAGMMFIFAYRIARWLQWAGEWREPMPWVSARVKQIRTKATFYVLVAVAGLILTLVRGPWLGALASGGILFVCRSRNRGAYVTLALAFLVAVGLPAAISFYNYVSVGRAASVTVAQESAAYRYELVLEYAEVAAQHLWWGWGRNHWPAVAGMPSIDNNFLLLALNHGLVAMLFFNLIPLWLMLRLAAFGVPRRFKDPTGLLAFSFVGVFVGMIVSLGTVALLSNIVPVYFMLVGWADGLLQTKGVPVPKPVVMFRYQRVMS